MANKLSIEIDVDGTAAVRELKQVDAAIDDVTGTTKKASEATADFEKQVRALIDKDVALITQTQQLGTATTKTTGTLATLRAGLNGVAEGAGLTYKNLGLLGSATTIASAAMAGWAIGRKISEFFGLDKAIGDVTARLIGWGNVQAQESGAKQDVINLAVRRGADGMITYAKALEFNAKWFVEWQTKAKAMDDVASRINAPKALADQMAKLNADIEKVRSAGALPALTEALKSHVIPMEQLVKTYRISEGAINLFKQRLADEAKAHTTAKTEATKHTAELKKLTTEHQRFVDSVKNLTSNSVGAVKGFGAYGVLITDISARSGTFREGLDDLDASMNAFHHGISIAGDELATVTIPMFAKLPDVVAQATDAIDAARTAVVSLGDTVRGRLRDALTNIPQLLTQAFTMGGGLMGAIKAIGVQISEAVMKPLMEKLSSAQQKAISIGSTVSAGVGAAVGGGTGAMVGSTAALAGGLALQASGMVAGSVALGAATMGIGLAAVAVYALWKRWNDHKKEVEANIKTINQFTDSMFSLATQAQVNESGNKRWALTVIQVRDAYLATGRTAAQAEADVKRLWDSAKKGAAETKAAMDLINQAFLEQKQDAADLDAAIQKYGFSIEELGPAMQRQELTQQAVQLENDFRLLVAAGVDLNVVLERMGGSINDFIHLAQKTGTEVPSEMKPILEKMIELGLLTDANGNKITDLGESGLTFSETMTQGFQRVVDKLTELINQIANTTGALNAIPDRTVKITYDDPGPPQNQQDYGSRGGLVTAHGIQYMAMGGNVLPFRPRGSDTVPAMLTPGERVLSVRQNRTYEAGGRGNSAAMEQKLERLAASQERTERYLTNKFAKDNARAIRDEVQKVARR